MDTSTIFSVVIIDVGAKCLANDIAVQDWKRADLIYNLDGEPMKGVDNEIFSARNQNSNLVITSGYNESQGMPRR